MARAIAVTGKGGAGKTTLAALLVRGLVEAGHTPVLAVDADPNMNLNTALGLQVEETVGDVREDGLQQAEAMPGGMAKAEFLRLRVQQALVESKGFDLLAMGRPEGPGCYCFANTILRACVDEIGKRYRVIVIDCEAGLEHLSRRTAGDLDVLLMVSDPSIRSLDTARRVMDLAEELHTSVGRKLFALNRVANGLPEDLLAAARARGLPDPILIPEDDEIRRLDQAGRPLIEVRDDNLVLTAIRTLLADLTL